MTSFNMLPMPCCAHIDAPTAGPTAGILAADALAHLKTMPPRSVQACITSPPYFRLRDYGADGQIGHEASVLGYINRLSEVFREVYRVLADDGVLWIVIGDRYNNKNLIGIPYILAFRLQHNGWIWRDNIIWHKKNCLPESVKDRCTKAHETILMMAKSERYYCDMSAIAEPVSENTKARILRKNPGILQRFGGNKYQNLADKVFSKMHRTKSGNAYNFRETRNKRNVWNVSTRPYKYSHFATFPKELILPCVLATSRPGDVVLDPFFGSGTTGVVAVETWRRFIGIDINPEYCELARRRISNAAEQTALNLGKEAS
jgi:site-specific DNA-methyltransferase (adenine-specific)